jgi:tetratricopeptide (TPR) repeat protein
MNGNGWRQSLVRLIPLLMAVPVVLAYANAFGGVFIFDDAIRLVRNDLLNRPWACMVGSSRPLTMLAFSLNARLTGVTPESFRAVNLALHIAAGWALYGWMRRSLALPSLQRLFGEGLRPWVAAAAATVWLVHPLQTESVTYIVQRSEVLMGLFYLVTLYALTRGAAAPVGHRWYTVSVVACALGMASKPVMATAPVMALVFDRTLIGGSFREAWRRRRPVHVALAATWLIPLALLSVPHESATSAGAGSGVTSWSAYLATQQGVVLHYARLAVWPGVLCLDYGWPEAVGWAAVAVPAAGVAILLAVAGWGVLKRRSWGYPALWFFAVLAPTSSVIPIADLAVEHRVYLPLAGLCALAVAGSVWLCQGSRLHADGPDRGRGYVPGAMRLWTVAVLVALVALGLRTRARNEDYGSSERMYRSILASRPIHFRAGFGLTKALLNGRRAAEAEATARMLLERAERGLREGGARYETSATSAAYYQPILRTQLGRALVLQGRYGEALVELDGALAWRPDDETIWQEKAMALHALGRKIEALDAAWRATELEPSYADPRALTAYMLAEDGEWAEAAETYRSLLKVAPAHVLGRLELAWILASAPADEVRDGEGAKRLVESVNRDTGGYSAVALDALAATQAETGDFAGATACAEQALAQVTADGVPPGDPNRPGDPVGIKARLRLYTDGRAFRQQKKPASD